MSRVFSRTAGVNLQSLPNETLGITDYPFSILCYVQFTNLNDWQFFYEFTNDTISKTEYVAGLKVAVSNEMQSRLYQSTDSPVATVGSVLADTTWYPHLLVAGATTSTLYALGETPSAATNTWSANNTPQLTIGTQDLGGFPLGGKISHFVVWDVELSSANITNIIGGADPLLIDAANQTRAWDFTDGTLDADLVDTITGTVTLTNNATTIDDADNPTFGAVTPVLSGETATAISGIELEGEVTTSGLATGTLYWYVDADITPPIAADLKAGVGSVIFGNQVVNATGLQTIASMTPVSAGTSYYVHYLHNDGTGDSAIVTTAVVTTLSQSVTVSAIVDGASLINLYYRVFDSQNIETMTELLSSSGETTDISGDLVIDLNSVTVTNGQGLLILLGDWSPTATITSKSAVCFADAVVA